MALYVAKDIRHYGYWNFSRWITRLLCYAHHVLAILIQTHKMSNMSLKNEVISFDMHIAMACIKRFSFSKHGKSHTGHVSGQCTTPLRGTCPWFWMISNIEIIFQIIFVLAKKLYIYDHCLTSVCVINFILEVTRIQCNCTLVVHLSLCLSNNHAKVDCT